MSGSPVKTEGVDISPEAVERDAVMWEDGGAPGVAKMLRALSAALTARDEALREAEAFVDRHSEPWYTSGQELLVKIRAALGDK